MDKRSGRDQSITIRARIGNVERGTSLRNSSINRKYATIECRQNTALHPGAKNHALFPVTPFDEEDSYLQFQ